MGKKIATNSFSKGLTTDYHPIQTPNTVLTDAINATYVTTNGDELVLQNDFGNVEIGDLIQQSEFDSSIYKKIPVGVKEYGGILYIASIVTHTEIIDNEELKPEFIRLMARNYLGSYLDFDLISKIITKAKQNLNIRTTENESISDALGGEEDEGSGF